MAALQWICTDPVEVPDITSYILSLLDQDIRDDRSSDVLAPLPDQASLPLSTFEKLPSEILSQINSFLQAPSALRLRRCSKTLTSRIVIDQTFWRDKVISGNLIDYLWDLDSKQCRQYDLYYSHGNRPLCNWKKLAQRLMRIETVESVLFLAGLAVNNIYILRHNDLDKFMSNAPLGLKNRCRIIKIIRDIEKLDRIEAEDPTLVEDGELIKPHKISLSSG